MAPRTVTRHLLCCLLSAWCALSCASPYQAPAIPAGEDPLRWSNEVEALVQRPPREARPMVFLGSSSMASAFDARTGKRLFKERLGPNTAIIASPVAGDGKVYLTSEEGTVHVLEAGAEFKVLATCPLGEPCFATPAISEGALFFRTTGSLVAVGKEPAAAGD